MLQKGSQQLEEHHFIICKHEAITSIIVSRAREQHIEGKPF